MATGEVIIRIPQAIADDGEGGLLIARLQQLGGDAVQIIRCESQTGDDWRLLWDQELVLDRFEDELEHTAEIAPTSFTDEEIVDLQMKVDARRTSTTVTEHEDVLARQFAALKRSSVKNGG